LDRCALFVDANYALAEGALVVHGTRNRDSVSWDYAGLLKLLGGLSRDRTGLPLLRCYWYDTAADGARAAEHEALADIPGVKLRLSKARPSRKEGVEAEIRRDLTALARNHGVSDVIIVSTEEDLAPVIAEVQDLGIRTVLFHIATETGWAISRTLRQECDDIIEIGAGHLQPYVDLISGAEPQLPAASFRELAGAAVQSSGPHRAIEAPAVRLYDAQLTPEYEQAALAGAGAGQVSGHRQDAPRFSGPGDSGDGQPLLSGAQHMQGTGPSQGQPMAQAQGPTDQQSAGQASPSQLGYPPSGQPSPGQQSPGLQSPGLQSPGLQSPSHQELSRPTPDAASSAQQYQRRPDPSRGQPQVGAEAGRFDPAGFAGQDNRGTQGQHGRPGPNDAGQNGLGHGPQGQNQFAQAQFGQSVFAQSQFGQAQPGQVGHAGSPGPGSNGASSQLPGGFGGQSAGHQGGTGSQPGGQPGVDLPSGGLRANGMPAGHAGQAGGHSNGMHAGAFQPHSPLPNGAPPNAMPPSGPPANGVPANRMSSGPSAMPGHDPRGALTQSGGTQHQDPSAGQPGYGRPGVGQAGPPAGQHAGSQAAPAMPAADVAPNGMLPPDGQRPPLPQRQQPPANGMPYAQDRGIPYGVSAQPAQFSGPVATSAYGQDSYGSQQQSALAPVAMSVGDAVQSAHAEGFGFGEAIARDAPALWLEAVLARKPRMPSDLEARLLQGSALPIDSLLHDEVRHALRRGFWDALERSRH
jgi:hypothetical protein